MQQEEAIATGRVNSLDGKNMIPLSVIGIEKRVKDNLNLVTPEIQNKLKGIVADMHDLELGWTNFEEYLGNVIGNARKMVETQQQRITLGKDLKFGNLLNPELQQELDYVLSMLGEIANGRVPNEKHIETRIKTKKATSKVLGFVTSIFTPSGTVIGGIKDGFSSGDALRLLEQKKPVINKIRSDLLRYPEGAIGELSELGAIKMELQYVLDYLSSQEYNNKLVSTSESQKNNILIATQGFCSTIQSFITSITLAESHINAIVPIVGPLYSLISEKALVAEFSLQLAMSSGQTSQTIEMIAGIGNRLDQVGILGQTAIMANTVGAQRSLIKLQKDSGDRKDILKAGIEQYMITIADNERVIEQGIATLQSKGQLMLKQ